MHEIRRVIDRLDHARCARKRASRIALRFEGYAVAGCRFQFRHMRFGREIGRHRVRSRGRGLGPVHLQGLDSAAGAPPTVGDHGNCARKSVDGMDAGHAANVSFILHGLWLAAEPRAVLDSGVEHAVDRLIDRVFRLTCRFVARVKPRKRLADPAEVCPIAERNLSRQGQRGSVVGYFAIRDRTTGGDVDHFARFSRKLGYRHAKLCRRRLKEHMPCGSAELTHRVVTHADGHAAARESPAARQEIVGTGWRTFDDEVRRVNIQLLTNDLRHGGEDSLPSFDEGTAEKDRAVGPDFQECRNPGAGCDSRRRGRQRTGPVRRKRDAENKRAQRRAKKAATGYLERLSVFASQNLGDNWCHVVHGAPSIKLERRRGRPRRLHCRCHSDRG